MEFFVESDSIVRRIWGKSDTILFIFGGAAAEFALNKAVDWLYFTGKLPADPLGRLFSTVQYARKIVFAEKEAAYKAIDTINFIHKSVENSRGAVIPDWAYRDVLFMLIYYSISSFEVLERQLTADEKEEVFQVFYRVGQRMNLKDLPTTYTEWLPVRDKHMRNDLEKSKFTIDLYKQYKKHLGRVRYFLLLQEQSLVVPPIVRNLLQLPAAAIIKPVLPLYKFSRLLKLDGLIKAILLPKTYAKEIKSLDLLPG